MLVTVVKVVCKVERPQVVYKLNASIRVHASKKITYFFSFSVVIVISRHMYNTDMLTKQSALAEFLVKSTIDLANLSALFSEARSLFLMCRITWSNSFFHECKVWHSFSCYLLWQAKRKIFQTYDSSFFRSLNLGHVYSFYLEV